MTATASRVVATGTLVRLREKRLEDAGQDYEWRRDPELASYDGARPLTMSLRTFVSSVEGELQSPLPNRRSFAIEELDGGLHIGNLMYYGLDRKSRETEIGITIGDRAYWSRGYGADAVRALLGYLFRELELRLVYLHTLVWNERAQRAFQRVGFRRVRDVHRGGHDFVLMEILDEHFDSQQDEESSH